MQIIGAKFTYILLRRQCRGEKQRGRRPASRLPKRMVDYMKFAAEGAMRCPDGYSLAALQNALRAISCAGAR